MSKVKYVLESIYLCVGLLFCSKQFVNDSPKCWNDVFEECGVSLK